MYERILVPVDGSEPSKRGLEEAVNIAKSTGSQLRLVHVVNEFVLDYGYGAGVYASNVIELLRQGGREILEAAKAAARAQGIVAECVMVEAVGGPPADLILAEAKSWGAQLIVMGTHGRRGLARLAMGSDAEQVLRGSAVPVLLVRGEAQKSTEAGKAAPEAA